MKFKVNGTKTTLVPKDAGVILSYLAQPDRYTPDDAEAKAAAKAAKGGEDNGAGSGD